MPSAEEEEARFWAVAGRAKQALLEEQQVAVDMEARLVHEGARHRPDAGLVLELQRRLAAQKLKMSELKSHQLGLMQAARRAAERAAENERAIESDRSKGRSTLARRTLKMAAAAHGGGARHGARRAAQRLSIRGRSRASDGGGGRWLGVVGGAEEKAVERAEWMAKLDAFKYRPAAAATDSDRERNGGRPQSWEAFVGGSPMDSKGWLLRPHEWQKELLELENEAEGALLEHGTPRFHSALARYSPDKRARATGRPGGGDGGGGGGGGGAGGPGGAGGAGGGWVATPACGCGGAAVGERGIDEAWWDEAAEAQARARDEGLSSWKAAPRIAAAASARRAEERRRHRSRETEDVMASLLEQTEELAAARAAAARRTRSLVTTALAAALCAAAAGGVFGLGFSWALPPDEVALLATCAVGLTSLAHAAVAPELLLLATRRAEQAQPPATHLHHLHNLHNAHQRERDRALGTLGGGGGGGGGGGAKQQARAQAIQREYERALGMGADGGHGAVRVRHCADDLADEMVMKQSEKLPIPGRRSSAGGGSSPVGRRSAGATAGGSLGPPRTPCRTVKLPGDELSA